MNSLIATLLRVIFSEALVKPAPGALKKTFKKRKLGVSGHLFLEMMMEILNEKILNGVL